ncbi:hypothetical protein [Legionella sp. 227]
MNKLTNELNNSIKTHPFKANEMRANLTECVDLSESYSSCQIKKT